MSRDPRGSEGRDPFAGLFRLLMAPEFGGAPEAELDDDEDGFLSSHRLAQGIASRLARLEVERERAPELVADLLTIAPLERQERIAANREITTWGTVEHLLERGRALSLRRDSAAIENFDLALAILPHLEANSYGAACIEDLAARTWTQLASARRREGDLDGAEQALEQANEHLLEGTGDVLEKAQLFEAEAEFHSDRGDTALALASIDRAIAVFRSTKDRHLGGLARRAKARIHRVAGQRTEAVRVGSAAVAAIDPERDLEAALAMRRELAADLNQLGCEEEAKVQLDEADRLEAGTAP